MRRAIALPFLMALLFSLVPVVSAHSPLAETVVRLDPASLEFGPEYCVSDTFTLAGVIDNVGELTGFGLQITWNTTYLEHVNHTMMVPVEDHPGGILHSPIVTVANIVDEGVGTYDVSAATLGGAPFTGSGTAFEITFRVKDQPIAPEPDIHFWIQYTLWDIGDFVPAPIPPPPQNCQVIIHAYKEPLPSPPVGGTSVSIDLGKFSSWITSTLLLVTVVITLSVRWNRRKKKT